MVEYARRFSKLISQPVKTFIDPRIQIDHGSTFSRVHNDKNAKSIFSQTGSKFKSSPEKML